MDRLHAVIHYVFVLSSIVILLGKLAYRLGLLIGGMFQML